MMQIRPARSPDLSGVIELLEKAALPANDIQAHLKEFLVAEDGEDQIMGAIGMEVYPPLALLRSLVVDPRFRGRGIARVLCARLVEQAQERGIDEMYLLTLDAAGYFERLGFSRMAREEAPTDIRKTKEFSLLCPDSATFMHSRLR